MARNKDFSGPQGLPPANDGAVAWRGTGGFGAEALGNMLDEAAINMSLVALNGTREAANHTGPLAAADAAKRLGDQLIVQMKSLETALAEVVRQPGR